MFFTTPPHTLQHPFMYSSTPFFFIKTQPPPLRSPTNQPQLLFPCFFKLFFFLYYTDLGGGKGGLRSYQPPPLVFMSDYFPLNLDLYNMLILIFIICPLETIYNIELVC